MTLDLLLPGLAWPADNVGDVTRDLDLPALSWLLSRATLSPRATTAFEDYNYAVALERTATSTSARPARRHSSA